MTKKHIRSIAFTDGTAALFSILPANGQTTALDSISTHAQEKRLSIGGYADIALTRNFYSDNVYRYSNAALYKDDKSHGRFDVPHAVIYLSYNFGKGWSMSSEIEFEHGGAGGAIEKEFEEAGEWEQETEKGGEVELEQLWIQKSFGRVANIRIGHFVVPVGLTNAYHEPTHYFTVYRPEGEGTILPCTWHDTGISFWGRAGRWRYEVQLVAGLDAFLFDRDNWIQSGSGTPFEFKVANKYGFAARIDHYALPGLRFGLSGYYGQSMHNTYPHDLENSGNKYEHVKGEVAVGALDLTYQGHNWIVRGNVDYGYVGDAATISTAKRNINATNAPYKKSPVGKNAVAAGVEAGYDIFSQIPKLRANNQRLYAFGRYEYYNSYIPAVEQARYEYTKRQRMAVGFNYYPLPQIAVKAEYSKRFLKSQYNHEPSISIGIAYEGFFL